MDETNLHASLICCQFSSKQIQDSRLFVSRLNEFKIINSQIRIFKIWKFNLSSSKIFADSIFCTIRNFCLISHSSVFINFLRHLVFSISVFNFNHSGKIGLSTFARSLIFKFQISAVLNFQSSKYWPSSSKLNNDC